MKKKKVTSRIGKVIKANGTLAVTNRGRFYGDIGGDVPVALILCTVDELAEVVKKTKAFQRTKLYKKSGGLHFTHLSLDVSFGFLPDSNEPILKRPTKRKIK